MAQETPAMLAYTDFFVLRKKLSEGLFCPLCGAALFETKSNDLFAMKLSCPKRHSFKIWKKEALDQREPLSFPTVPKFKGENRHLQLINWWLGEPKARKSLGFDIADLLGAVDVDKLCVKKREEETFKVQRCLLCGKELTPEKGNQGFEFKCTAGHALHVRANVLWAEQEGKNLTLWLPLPTETALGGMRECMGSLMPLGFLPESIKNIFEQILKKADL